MVYSIHPGFTKSIEKKFTRFILYIKSDISMRSTIAHFVKILFPYQKAIMPNRLNNKTKMTHKYLYGLVS